MKRIALIVLFQLCCFFSYSQAIQKADSVKVYSPTEVDVIPDFKGGDKKFLKFIRTNIVYPKRSKEDNISGLVIIRMTIAGDGSTSDFKVVKSLQERFDVEASRVAALTTNLWVPAKRNGENVAFSYLLPIRFYGSKPDKESSHTNNIQGL